MSLQVLIVRVVWIIFFCTTFYFIAIEFEDTDIAFYRPDVGLPLMALIFIALDIRKYTKSNEKIFKEQHKAIYRSSLDDDDDTP